MSDRLVTSQSEFDDFCTHVREAGAVAFDTEFISENTYRPQLCLAQFATREACVAVDPFEVDLTEWWDIMVDNETTIVVHAGREETRFCLTHRGAPPRKMWDVQIAEGLRCTNYPLSYERLIARVLGKSVSSAETRTDWSRRPLTTRQISYALDDVRFVLDVLDTQQKWLDREGRLSWAEEETERMIGEMLAERGDDTWLRLSGVRRLRPKQLVVARELYRWRDRVADKSNQPLRRILRDDLLIDIAKRQPQTESELLRSREMGRPNFRRHAHEIVSCVERALKLPKDQWPAAFSSKDSSPDEPVLGKLLAIALANRCAELGLSTGLVGTSNDLKELVRWYNAGCPEHNRPTLETGWRSEVCGDLLRQVLEGKVSLRVADPSSDHPLVFEPVE
ncbi:ribonuclease D [bacterium]|nr:ribonuclease D [bacterium]